MPKIEHTVTGHNSVAFGVWDYPIPTGTCTNPRSKEIDKVVEEDKLGQLLDNPIDRCIFFNPANSYCFYSGACNKKSPISNEALSSYKNDMELYIAEKFGERPQEEDKLC